MVVALFDDVDPGTLVADLFGIGDSGVVESFPVVVHSLLLATLSHRAVQAPPGGISRAGGHSTLLERSHRHAAPMSLICRHPLRAVARHASPVVQRLTRAPPPPQALNTK